MPRALGGEGCLPFVQAGHGFSVEDGVELELTCRIHPTPPGASPLRIGLEPRDGVQGARSCRYDLSCYAKSSPRPLLFSIGPEAGQGMELPGWCLRAPHNTKEITVGPWLDTSKSPWSTTGMRTTPCSQPLRGPDTRRGSRVERRRGSPFWENILPAWLERSDQSSQMRLGPQQMEKV